MEKLPDITEIESFRQKLVSRKNDLSQKIHKIDRDIRHEGMTADWSEQATERENDEVLESLGIDAEQELDMIKLALTRIDLGEYFDCRSCGAPIPRARLELVPYSSLCVKCANLLDQ